MSEQESWLDRAINAVSPTWGLRRVRARMAHQMLEQVRSGYEGARKGRRTLGWLTPSTDAGTEAGKAGPVLRNRARDLVRNDPLAAQAVRVWSTALVGSGLTPRVPGAKRPIDEYWREFAHNCSDCGDFAATLRVAVETMVVSGEVLVRLGPGLGTPENPSGIHLQILETDHLDRGVDRDLPDGGRVVRGIEYDAAGHRRAYHVLREHPGAGTTRIRMPPRDSERVPAEQMIHLYHVQRPGQDLGVSWFAPVVLKLMDLADYNEAELVRNKIAACFAVFVENEEGLLGEETTGQGDGGKSRIEKLFPGMIRYLRAGERVQFANPSGPTANYAPYSAAW